MWYFFVIFNTKIIKSTKIIITIITPIIVVIIVTWFCNTCWNVLLDVKNDVLARITEPSKDDYDNGVSDNCDHSFGTFDDFGVKNNQKVSHNMILMSKYKGKHGGKKGQKIQAGVSPLIGQCPKEEKKFLQEGFPKASRISVALITTLEADNDTGALPYIY